MQHSHATCFTNQRSSTRNKYDFLRSHNSEALSWLFIFFCYPQSDEVGGTSHFADEELRSREIVIDQGHTAVSGGVGSQKNPVPLPSCLLISRRQLCGIHDFPDQGPYLTWRERGEGRRKRDGLFYSKQKSATQTGVGSLT